MPKIEIAKVNTPLNSHEFQDQINRNFEKVSEALDNQLQRTAQEDVANYMEQELDMGGNRIINLAKAVDPSDAMRKKEFDEKIANIEQWAQEAKDSAVSAAEDANDAEAAKRVAVSAAQSAQEHERQTQDLFDTLMADDAIRTVHENIEDVKIVAADIDSINITADNIEDIEAVFDIAKRIAYGNIGDIRATFAATAPDGCRFTDGSKIRKEDYPELFEMLDKGGIPFDSVSVWTSNVNNHGITGAFGYNRGSSEAYLPLLTEAFVEATNNTPHRVNEAAMPEHGHKVKTNVNAETYVVNDLTYNPTEAKAFNASPSHYAASATRITSAFSTTANYEGGSAVGGVTGIAVSDKVQPKSIMLRHYVVLTNSRQMILTVRTPVATKSALPTTGNINGDIRIVTNEGTAYVWARVGRDSWMWSSIGRVGTGAGGPTEWGYIEGDMTKQTDLQEALDKKITNNSDEPTNLIAGLGAEAVEAFTGNTQRLALGYQAKAKGEYSIAIGSRADSKRWDGIAIGHDTLSDYNSIVLGNNSKARASGSIIIGTDCYDNSYQNAHNNLIGPGVNILIGQASSIAAITTEQYHAFLRKSYNIAVGSYSRIDGLSSIAIGSEAEVLTGDAKRHAVDDSTNRITQECERGSIAIGTRAKVTAPRAVQLGTGTNSSEGSLQFRDYQLVDANGKIPAERLPDDIGDSYKALDETQKTQLLANGTYEGSEVADGEVFTEYVGKFVEFDKILKDAGTWETFASNMTIASLRGVSNVAEGNGAIVIAYNGKGAVSYDGINWEMYSNSGLPMHDNALIFDGTQFVAYTSGMVSKSTDGKTWTAETVSDGPDHTGIRYFSYDDGRYIIITDDKTVWSSEDAITWAQNGTLPSGLSTHPNITRRADGLYLALDSSAKVSTSSNLTEWTEPVASNISISSATGSPYGIASIGNVFTTLLYSSSGRIYWSEDGVTWTAGKFGSSTTAYDISRLRKRGDKLFANGERVSTLYVSEDGKTFTKLNEEFPSKYLTAIAYGFGKTCVFYASAYSSPTDVQLAVSSDSPYYEYDLLPLSYTKDEVDAAIAGMDLSSYLQNLSTADNSLSIAGYAAEAAYSTNVGFGSNARERSTSLGCGAVASGRRSVAIGQVSSTSADSDCSIAMGYRSSAEADHAIQLGYGTNSVANTMNVGLSNTLNVQLLDANGNIPAERLVNAPTPDLSEYTTRSSFTGSNGISMGFKEVTDYTLVGTLTISDGVVSGYNTASTNYLQAENRVTQVRPSSYEIGCAFTVASLPSSVSSGRILSFSNATSETGVSSGIAINGSGLLQTVGPAGLTGTTVFAVGTKVYAKLTYDSTTGYVLYSSTDGVTWNQEASGTNIGFATGGANMFIGRFAYSTNPTIYLKECYAIVDGVEVWRGYSEKMVAELDAPTQEATTAPTTNTVGKLGQVYVDTATGTGYMCVGVDAATPAYTWKQVTA